MEMKKDFMFGELNQMAKHYTEGSFQMDVINAMNRTAVKQTIAVMDAYGISSKTIRHEDLEMFFHAISGKTPDAPIRNRLPVKYDSLSEFFTDTAERLAAGKLMGSFNGIDALLTRLEIAGRRHPGVSERELVELDPMVRAQFNTLVKTWGVANEDLDQAGKYASRQAVLLKSSLNGDSPWMTMARNEAAKQNDLSNEQGKVVSIKPGM